MCTETVFELAEAESLHRLSQSNGVIPADVDQRVSVPATDAQEEAPGIVDGGSDGAKHHFEATGSACPHGVDGTADVYLMLNKIAVADRHAERMESSVPVSARAWL